MTRQHRNSWTIFAPAVLVIGLVVALGVSRPARAQEGGETPDLITATCTFVDTDWIFHDPIRDACTAGLISGCGGDRFCPGEYVMREDMAIYLEKLYRGWDFVPAAITADPFPDVSKTYPFAPWIRQLGPACDGITSGCGTGYCPYSFVSRWEMSVFLSVVTSKRRGLTVVPASGSVPNPPPARSYNCVAGGISLFTDVPPSDGGCKFIHYMYSLGITAGCGGTSFCPWAYVPREEMATFLIGSFNTQIPGHDAPPVCLE